MQNIKFVSMKNFIALLPLFMLVSLNSFIGVESRQGMGTQATSPVIGVMTHPGDNGGQTYLASSYVKWIESAGGRVVPIPYDMDDLSDVDKILSKVNGVLFPGGHSNLNPTAQHIYSSVLQMNKDGDYFPLWGTCLGFEWLMMSQSQNETILANNFDSENLTLALQFESTTMRHNFDHSRIFSQMTTAERALFTDSKDPVTMNNHGSGVMYRDFLRTPKLRDFFSVLSVNEDREKLRFVSTVEAHLHPIYGVQWHPEKNPYEVKMDGDAFHEVTNHGSNAVVAAFKLAKFFVDECRKSKHSYSNAEELIGDLVYNYPVKYQKGTSSSFMEKYLFPF